jgi:phosphatidylinositol alpha-mannosyltransferase
MKIAMTHVDLPNETRGGVAAQAHYLANSLTERGHEVTMFTFSPAFEGCRYRVRTLHKTPSKINRIWPAGAFARELARTDFSKFDVLHTHGDNYLLKKRPGLPKQVRTFHGSARDEAGSATRLRRRVYQWIVARLERKSQGVADIDIGISTTTKQRVPSVTQIISCGVDTSLFSPSAKSPHPTILFVGTVEGRKRGSLLAETFTKTVRSQCPDAELWSVADGDLPVDGVKNFGKVPLDQLVRLYQEAWVFCLPSTYEGFGVPYIEAMAAGTPVVATANPGANEVLAEGQHGIISADDSLGKSLCELLQNEDLRAEYARSGVKRAQDYSWTRITQQYEDVYSSLLQPNGPDAARISSHYAQSPAP